MYVDILSSPVKFGDFKKQTRNISLLKIWAMWNMSHTNKSPKHTIQFSMKCGSWHLTSKAGLDETLLLWLNLIVKLRDISFPLEQQWLVILLMYSKSKWTVIYQNGNLHRMICQTRNALQINDNWNGPVLFSCKLWKLHKDMIRKNIHWW